VSAARLIRTVVVLVTILDASRSSSAQVRVNPKGGPLEVPVGSTGQTANFSLTGLVSGQRYTLEWYCSGATPSCTSPQGSFFTASAYGANWPISFNASSSPGTGQVKLKAFGAGSSDSGWFNVTVATYGVTVTPDGPTTAIRAANSGGYSESFTIANTGSLTKTFTLSCSGQSGVTCGTVPGPVTLAPNGHDTTVAMPYSVGAVGTGRLVLTATGTNASDAGSYWIPIVAYGVAVTPDGAPATARPPNTSGLTENFTVQNTGSGTNTYTLTCAGSPNITCTGLTIDGAPASSVNLYAGTAKSVVAAYNTSAIGTGTLTLRASGTNASDSGTYSVPVVTPSPQPPVVDINSVNSGTFVERGLCLTIAAGAAAASQCGDLRIIHPLPTTRTMNKVRTPTLLYNSQTAHPYPIVAANVTLPWSAVVPDSVTAALWVGPPQGTRKWLGNQWAPGQSRRIAFGFEGLSLATGVYAYTLEVRNWYPSPTPSQPTTVNGELIVVNRSNSPFGAGWWLAGIEQLFWLADGRRLVILGDGSARVYAPVGGNLYTAANPTRPDTLDGTGVDYVRRGPHGVRVHLSATDGTHISTVNRLGEQTTFAYDACTQRRLRTITLPPGGPGNVYTFNYASPTDCATRLVSVTSPGNRTSNLTDPSGQLTAINDPDTHGIGFAYDPAFANRIISRTDRRSNTTFFAFDAGGKIITDSVPLETGQTPIVQRLRPSESIGLTAPIDTALAYTRVDGARIDVNDTTAFWLDRYGAPRRVMNAMRYVTELKREDARWPALVTELRAPNQFVTRATYDARGNDSTTKAVNPFGDGRDAVTRFHWDPKWDFVDSIITPMGVISTFAYDPNNGNRLWQQTGPDVTRRVTFNYGNANKLLSSVVLQSTIDDSLIYDAQWNVLASRTTRGFWTSFYKDSLGRDTLVVTPIDSTDKSRGGGADLSSRARQRTVFTIMGLDSILETIAPNQAEEIRVDKRYDLNGNLLSLARVSIPDPTNPAIGTITTQWHYDRANRKVAEIAPDGMPDSTVYDPAGNAVSLLTRRKDPTTHARVTINMTYDTLNRVTSRVLPPITYQSRPTAIQIQNNGWPWVAPPYPAYAIPSETQTFTYDSVGNLVTADNADAKVKRTYYANGLIQTDSVRIQTVARDNWETHKYGLSYKYDLDGRRDTLLIPDQLRPDTVPRILYFYNSDFGFLQSIWDIQKNAYQLSYSSRGDLISIQYPGSYSEIFGYDADGQLAADTVRNSGSAAYPRIQSAPFVRSVGLFYDARHKLLLSGDGVQLKDTLQPTYTGLGSLKSTRWLEHGCNGCQLQPTDRHVVRETSLGLDAFANVTQSQSLDSLNGNWYGIWGSYWHYQSVSPTCCDTWSYQPGTGRMTTMSVFQEYPRSFSYDSAGNQDFSSSVDPGNVVNHHATERASFFAADGSLRMVDARSTEFTRPFAPGEWQTYVVEDYRYDALGRRVWTRSRRWCDSSGQDWPAATECRVGTLRRTIWDGNRELAEIQKPWALQVNGGDTTQYSALWENDVTPVSLPLLNMSVGSGDPNTYFGHVIYTTGLAIDRPIAITRVNYVMKQDWLHRDGQHVYTPARVKAPFTIMPFWNAAGDAPVGVFQNGDQFLCGVPHIGPGADTGCVAIRWPFNWSSSDRNGGLPHDYWHGTLLDGKNDGSGFRYMRNRYYDPLTGRFTQEDPIGLAGGVNLYGFANGDPINFSDPFGLKFCIKDKNKGHIQEIKDALSYALDARIDWDEKTNCVKGQIHPGKNTAFRGLQTGFQAMVNSDVAYAAKLGGGFGSPQSSPTEITVETDINVRVYHTGSWGVCDGGIALATMPQAFAHELEHRFSGLPPGPAAEEDAIQRGDNVYNPNGRPPQPLRCDHWVN